MQVLVKITRSSRKFVYHTETNHTNPTSNLLRIEGKTPFEKKILGTAELMPVSHPKPKPTDKQRVVYGLIPLENRSACRDIPTSKSVQYTETNPSNTFVQHIKTNPTSKVLAFEKFLGTEELIPLMHTKKRTNPTTLFYHSLSQLN